MSRFDECLYAADFLDPVRYFPEQDDVRPLAARDFDAALLAMCRGTISSVVSRQRILDHASVDYYNDLLVRLADPGRPLARALGVSPEPAVGTPAQVA